MKFSVLRVYHKIIEPLRDVAYENGYALTVHGSLARDIDLVPIPWTDRAIPAAELYEGIRAKTEEILGAAIPDERYPQPEVKPHGRLAWSFQVGGTYIDLSVMPTRPFDEYWQSITAQREAWEKTHPPQP